MNPIDVMDDVLMFRGFWRAPFIEKIKWLFILYPFFLGVLLFHLILWIPVLPIVLKRKLKKKN